MTITASIEGRGRLKRLTCRIVGHRWMPMQTTVRVRFEDGPWHIRQLDKPASACGRCGATTRLEFEPEADYIDAVYLAPMGGNGGGK